MKPDHDSQFLPILPEQVELKFDTQGLIPAIVQDFHNGEVLMLAYMNRAAFELSLTHGTAHFWSRSRQMIWHKGATSGNFQRIKEIRIDCDNDTLLLKVIPAGAACHTGQPTCFFRSIQADPNDSSQQQER